MARPKPTPPRTCPPSSNDFSAELTGTGEAVFFMKNLPKHMPRMQALNFAATLVKLLKPSPEEWQALTAPT